MKPENNIHIVVRYVRCLAYSGMFFWAIPAISLAEIISGSPHTVQFYGAQNAFNATVSGGEIAIDLLDQNDGQLETDTKSMAGTRLSPMVFQFNPTEIKTSHMIDWINATLSGRDTDQHGVVKDDSGKTREFSNALITEFSFPALDASNQEPALITVHTSLGHIAATTSQVNTSSDVATKKWMPSNFRFELGDLPCDRVSKIDSFSWRQYISRDGTRGQARISKLRLEIDARDYDSWLAYFQNILRSGSTDEKMGSITWYQQDQKAEHGSISLSNVILVSLTAPRASEEDPSISRFVATLHIGRIDGITAQY